MTCKRFAELATAALLAFPPISADLPKIFKGYPSGRVLPSGQSQKYKPLHGEKCTSCVPVKSGH